MDSKEKLLRKTAEKTLPFFKRLNIPAELVTSFRILFAFFVAYVFLQGNFFYSAIILTIYQFILMSDYIDGKLAKSQKRFSVSWVKIDYFFHYFVSFLFIASLTSSEFNSNGNFVLMYLGYAGSLLILASSLIAMMQFNKVRLGGEGYKGKFLLIYSYIGLDTPFSLFFFLIIFNLIPIAIVSYSFLYLLILLRKLK